MPAGKYVRTPEMREAFKKLMALIPQPWNKNKTGIYSKESLEKMSASAKLRKPISEETKKKLSIAFSGKNNPMYGVHLAGKKNPMFGVRMSGEKHWNWKGGLSKYPLEWTTTFKEQIRQRDSYKCQICGSPEIENCNKLCVHHIDYDKKNLNPTNLISLCTSCHIKTNYKRSYWIDYFEKRNT